MLTRQKVSRVIFPQSPYGPVNFVGTCPRTRCIDATSGFWGQDDFFFIKYQYRSSCFLEEIDPGYIEKKGDKKWKRIAGGADRMVEGKRCVDRRVRLSTSSSSSSSSWRLLGRIVSLRIAVSSLSLSLSLSFDLEGVALFMQDDTKGARRRCQQLLYRYTLCMCSSILSYGKDFRKRFIRTVHRSLQDHSRCRNADARSLDWNT